MNLAQLKKMSPTAIVNHINTLEADKKALEEDRDKYRVFIKKEIQHQIQVMGENKYWQPKSILERLIAHTALVKPYYIWW